MFAAAALSSSMGTAFRSIDPFQSANLVQCLCQQGQSFVAAVQDLW